MTIVSFRGLNDKGGVILTSLVKLVLSVTDILILFSDGTTALKMILFYEVQTKLLLFAHIYIFVYF